MRQALNGWRLATIRDVDLKIHPSLILLLAYVVVVAGSQFAGVVSRSGVDPSTISGGALAWGLVFALALFGSVVLHEFGHVLMAQRLGVRVSGVTLMMLGGVSEMERMPEERYAEFKVAIVGPLVSLGIAASLFALQQASVSGNVALFCYWLARVNAALAVFNLLPAFPLDGGRAFRSLLAARQGPARATVAATRVGKGMAMALGVLGLFGGNFMLMLIAAFVYVAASQELSLSSSRTLLTGLRAADAGRRIAPLRATDLLADAAERMMETHARVLPVEPEPGAMPGLLDVERLRSVPRSGWRLLRVGDVMARAPRALGVDTPLDEALPELAALGVMPLEEEGRVVGVVQYRDLTDLIELRSLGEAPRADKAA